MGRSIVAVALSALMSISAVYAHDDANHVFNIADPGFDITSDFGPRYTNGTLFHKAIDFRRTAGQPLPLLGDGIITDLLRGGSGIIRLTVNITQNGVLHRIRYMHLFDDTALPICSGGPGGFVLANHIGGGLAIVKLGAGSTTRADYILAQAPGNTVTVNFNSTASTTCNGFTGAYTFQTQDVDVNGNPVVDQNGFPVFVNAETEDDVTVADHPSIGPSGTSGGHAPHMHLEMAPGPGSGWVGAANSENPLFHMPDRNTQYNVRVLDKDSSPRLDGFVVGPQDTKSSFVRVEVDSRTALDLEEVSIYVDQTVAANLIRQFKLGGNTEADDRVNLSNAEIDTAATEQDANGTRPLRDAGNEGIAGLERYVYIDWEAAGSAVSPSSLSEGAHTLIIELTDIHGNTEVKNFNFNIDSKAPVSSLTVTQN